MLKVDGDEPVESVEFALGAGKPDRIDGKGDVGSRRIEGSFIHRRRAGHGNNGEPCGHRRGARNEAFPLTRRQRRYSASPYPSRLTSAASKPVRRRNEGFF
jgi:hypothetical protein